MSQNPQVQIQYRSHERRKINGTFVDVYPDTTADHVSVESWYGDTKPLSEVLQDIISGKPLLPATSSSLGGVIVGNGLDVGNDGTLFVDNAKVMMLSGDQTVGGVKTFTSKITLPSGTPGIVTTTANSYLQLCGGQSNLNDQGATLSLVGTGNSTDPGTFALKAANSTNEAVLRGKPDGTLIWDGKDVLRVSKSGSNYIRFSSGLQICWGNVSVATASTAVTFPKAFSASPDIVFGLRPGSASSRLYNVLAYPRSTTGFTAYANDANGHMAAVISYIAIGSWS